MATSPPAQESLQTRRSSSGLVALMTLNCNLPNIPIINLNENELMPAADGKKKSLRFDTNTFMSEYETEEIKENKRKITAEIKK